MLKCPSCQARNAHGRRTCRRCGHDLAGLSASASSPKPSDDDLPNTGEVAIPPPQKAGPQNTAPPARPVTPANASHHQTARAAPAAPQLKLRNQRPEVPFTIENEEDDVFTSADRPEAFEVAPTATSSEGLATAGAASQMTYIPGKGIVDLNPDATQAPSKKRSTKHTTPRRAANASAAKPAAKASTSAAAAAIKPPPLPDAAPLINGDSDTLNPDPDQRVTREELRAVGPTDIMARQAQRASAADQLNHLPRPRPEKPSTPPPLPPGVRREATPMTTPPTSAVVSEDAAEEATLVSATPVPRPLDKDSDMSEIARLGSLFTEEKPSVTPTNPFTIVEPASEDERGGDDTPGIALLKLDAGGEIRARMPLTQDRLIIGREDGDVVLHDDPTVSPWHAQLRFDGAQALLKDMNSLNGVYVRLSEPVTLRDGDSILAGNQRFVFRDTWDSPTSAEETTKALGAEGYDDPSRLMLMRAGGQCVGVYFIGQALTIGRESGELIFAADEQMDHEHARIVCQDNGEHTLHDLGSADGVFVAIRGEVSLQDEQCFQVGRTRFRLTLHS